MTTTFNFHRLRKVVRGLGNFEIYFIQSYIDSKQVDRLNSWIRKKVYLPRQTISDELKTNAMSAAANNISPRDNNEGLHGKTNIDHILAGTMQALALDSESNVGNQQ